MSELLNDKETSLLKFCLYYDGTNESTENELWGSALQLISFLN